MELGTVVINGTSYPVKRATFTVLAGADSDVVAAVDGKAICCVGIYLAHSSASVAATPFNLRSNTTDLTPQFMFVGRQDGVQAGGQFVFPKDGVFSTILAQTSTGEALNVNSAGGLSGIVGVVFYVER